MLQTKKHLIIFLTFLFASHAQSAPLNGNAIFEDVQNTAITGDIDIANNTMNVSDWYFFGSFVVTEDIELLQPGSYTRISGDVTVPENHIGAHIKVSWLFNEIYTYMVWNVTDGGATYSIIDSDGDGRPGHALTNGPFAGATVYYVFETTPTGPPEPNINLVVNIEGGSEQECTGDSAAEVTINASASLVGGAILDSISWIVDGYDAGTGSSITRMLALGSYNIEATGLTTTGKSNTKSVIVNVVDTTRPVAVVTIVDNQGNEVLSSHRGKFKINIDATDSCDPNPVITSSTATPTTTVSNGDTFFINPKGGIKIPVTAVRISVTAKDASDNFSYTDANSTKTITFE